MALVNYDPLNLLNRFHEELLRNRNWPALLGDEESNIVTSHWVPAVDIKEENDCYVLIADVPGVDPRNIEVTMENGMLTIKGERKTESTEEKEGYKRIERSRGTFYRRFSLPDTADTERIKADSKDGVLQLTIPKREAIMARKIEVKS
jgi:Molecular chaperone (small heat shock protein)